MSTIQRGEDNPAGILNGTFISSPDGTGEFKVQPYFFEIRRGGALKERYGTLADNTAVQSYRQVKRDGTGSAFVTITTEAPPEPVAWKGKTLTITVQYGANRDGTLLTIAYDIIVESFELKSDLKASFNSTSTEYWFGLISFRVTTDPTYSAGWGTQPVAETVAPANVKLYNGTRYTLDQDNLQTASDFLIDWFSSSVTDPASLNTILTAAFGAWSVTNFDAHLKINPGTIRQDSPTGGTIHIPAQLTTPAERVENAGTYLATDPNGLDTSQSIASFGTPGSLASGLVEIVTSTQEHNDQKTLSTKHGGTQSTVQRRTFPGTYVVTDQSNIAIRTTEKNTQVTSSSSEASFSPSGSLKKNTWIAIQLTNSGKYLHVHEAGLTTPQEATENANSTRHYDPDGIEDYQIIGKVLSSVTTTPGVSPTDTTLSNSGADIVEIHDAAFLHRYKSEKLTPKERREHAGTSARADLRSPASSTVITAQTEISTVLSADDVAEINSSLFSASMNDITFNGCETTKLNKLRALKRTYRVNDNLLIILGMPSLHDGNLPVDNSGANCMIDDSYPAGSGQTYISLGFFRTVFFNQTLIIRRRYKDWNAPTDLATFLFPGLRGLTNNATFLGFPTGSVRYIAPTLSTNYSVSSDHAVVIDHALRIQLLGSSAAVNTPGHLKAQVKTGKYILVAGDYDTEDTPAIASIRSGWQTEFPGQADLAPLLA